jgi:hypothetical protein
MRNAAVLCCLVALAVAPAAGAADTAKGSLVVAGKPIALSHAYAYATKGFFDPKKQDVVALLCDAEVPAAAVRDDFARGNLVTAGKLHCVRQTVDTDKQVINYAVEDSRFHPPEGGASSFHVFDATTFDGKTIAGRAHTTADQKSFNDIPYTYDVTFSAAIAPKGK